ncbi:MAG: hypothetical protein O7G86_13705 [Gammaproteobacteria bacterium]|nr:hypothetical protein [Gammaproteobacteria bacterium]
MKKIALIFVGVLITLYIAVIFVPFEPDERRPGTRLGGDLAHVQDTDWSFLQGRNQIFVETRTWYLIPHSVTTTSWVADGAFYVPCGSCDSKRWPKNVERDPRVRLKINESIYERKAIRITDPEERRRLMRIRLPEGVALYRMDPR